MSINSNYIKINMPLYETDKEILQKFIMNEKIDGQLTEKYLILYDFATDCIYAKSIQPELIKYLLPFYLKAIEQAFNSKNKVATDIYCNFNSAIFINQKNFEYAIGGRNYQYVMEFYVKQTVKRMEMGNPHIMDWISLLNTTIAMGLDNVVFLFHKIFTESLNIKYSFFKYLSILLFKESDNLLVTDISKIYWTDCVWWFDSQASSDFFWRKDIIEYFGKEISKEKIEVLFKEIQPLLYVIFEVEIVALITEEINKSFITGIFYNRKVEYLKKMNCKTEKYKCWDNY